LDIISQFTGEAIFLLYLIVCGEIQGKKIQPLGEIDYTYPLISAKEIHLWPLEKKDRVYYPCPYWHYPWWYGPY